MKDAVKYIAGRLATGLFNIFGVILIFAVFGALAFAPPVIAYKIFGPEGAFAMFLAEAVILLAWVAGDEDGYYR